MAVLTSDGILADVYSVEVEETKCFGRGFKSLYSFEEKLLY